MNSVRKLVPDLPESGPEPVPGQASAGVNDDTQTTAPAATPLVGPVPVPQPVPVASWYAQGMSDGLGDRLLMFDNTAAASLELLRFRPELAAAPGFEGALRDSVERLAFFKHTAFAQARAVERLDGDDALALVSTHTAGKRLSDLFQSRQPRAGMHPAFVTWLIRQLAPAVADFHGYGRGIAHGALTAERIVLTPDGHVVVVEHVLGAALDQLCLSPTQLWRDLGVVAVPGFDGVPRLNGHADVVQLALMALSVLLGRRVTPEDYAHRLDALLDEFADTAGRRSPALVPPLREWLERALRLGERGFASALDAARGLDELPAAGGQQVFEHLQHPRTLSASTEASMKESPDVPVRAPIDLPRSAGVVSTATHVAAPVDQDEAELLHPAAVLAGESRDALHPITFPSFEVEEAHDSAQDDAAAPSAGGPPLFGAWSTTVEHDPPLHVAKGSLQRFLTARNIAIAAAFLAFAEAAIIAGLLNRPDPAPVPVPIPVTIDSPVAGDVVMVDGRQVGVTPFNLDVVTSMRSIRVHSLDRLQAAAPPAAPAPAPAETESPAAGAIAAAATRQRPGGLRVSSSIELQVLEGERVLGSSADGPIVASAGTHQLDFINNALGFRSRQTVEIKAGEIVGLTIRPPDGRMSINAQPWAQVWIDGKLVGETPLANLSVPVGEHEIIFRHPQLGEKREKALVKAGSATRLSATMGR
jgi:hypothetical protein